MNLKTTKLRVDIPIKTNIKTTSLNTIIEYGIDVGMMKETFIKKGRKIETINFIILLF